MMYAYLRCMDQFMKEKMRGAHLQPLCCHHGRQMVVLQKWGGI